jgi:hypothetical protein
MLCYMYRNDILKFRYIWSGAPRLHHGQSFERFSLETGVFWPILAEFPTTSNTQSIAYRPIQCFKLVSI